ncbi:hypothetical protein E2C01_038518 [Portunus trituberculatus]|uniref:Uncharacterized protein n=1 Tax=Portunus trituberculatus TaxID=210409 RepID=A0A5B7FIR7_PORTR|nr:hypothetical protein [Portunus trituberculatus]
MTSLAVVWLIRKKKKEIEEIQVERRRTKTHRHFSSTRQMKSEYLAGRKLVTQMDGDNFLCERPSLSFLPETRPKCEEICKCELGTIHRWADLTF